LLQVKPERYIIDRITFIKVEPKFKR